MKSRLLQINYSKYGNEFDKPGKPGNKSINRLQNMSLWAKASHTHTETFAHTRILSLSLLYSEAYQ